MDIEIISIVFSLACMIIIAGIEFIIAVKKYRKHQQRVNEQTQRQIDDLKRELEGMKKQTELQS